MLCRLFSFICVLVFCNSLSCYANGFHGCEKLLHELADKQKNFVQCATIKSVPVNFCIGCKLNHSEMLHAYDLLVGNKTCNEKYFDKDRINIVATTESILTGLWNKAFCDDCFKNDNLINFTNKSSDLHNCFATHNLTECTSCVMQYQDLNSFYIGMDQHNNGQVCYDFQDEMNRTRKLWSDDYKCCHREINRSYFSITSIFVSLLPIIFYGIMYNLTKRRERLHGLLNAEPELQASPPPPIHSDMAQQDSDPRIAVPSKHRKLRPDSDDDVSDASPENNYHKKLINL